MSFADRFRQQPRFLIIAETLLVLGVIGVCDLLSGYELSMFIFYGIPILMALWFIDQKFAFAIALLAGIVWWWADVMAGHVYLARWLLAWNVSMRTIFFVLIVIGGNALKTQHASFAAQLAVVNQLRLLEQEIVVASEREQQRIGQDIHDGLCQHLAAISFAAASLREDLPPREAAAAAEIEELLKEAIHQARNIARGLAPVPMDNEGLAAALQDLAARISRLSDLRCHFAAIGEIPPLAPEVASHLFRIAQEATNNVIKHAEATRMEIRLTGRAADTELSIRDDGQGWPGGPEPGSGMGLKNMRYRARIIGGTFAVGRAEEGGACLTCCIPKNPAP